MKQKFTRRATAILLALLLACTACMPAMAASKQASGTTLGDFAQNDSITLSDLIELDKNMIQKTYLYSKNNYDDNNLQATILNNREKKTWLLQPY